MKRSFILFIAILLIASFFSGCLPDPDCEHNWIEANCQSPKTCTTCSAQEGSVGDHEWTEATCQAPKTCETCGKTEGEANSYHDWTEEAENSPSICVICKKMQPLSTTPEAGQVLVGDDLPRNSRLTIKNKTFADGYVSLVDESGKEVFAFFIKGFEITSESIESKNLDPIPVTVSVPAGKYYMNVASGADWYGTEHLFGDNTSHLKGEELLDFNTYEYTYTLSNSYSNNNVSSSIIGNIE